MIRWEYTRRKMPEVLDYTKWLNQLGREGWELVQIWSDHRFLDPRTHRSYPIAVLKRPVVEQPEPLEEKAW